MFFPPAACSRVWRARSRRGVALGAQVLSPDLPMTAPALDNRTPMADIDALIESVDDERARAAAGMDVDEERRSKMATPIQAHARGMLARRNTTREESSLVQKARRASAGLVDFTRSLYLELTELTDPAPAPAVAASPAVPPGRNIKRLLKFREHFDDKILGGMGCHPTL